MLFGCHVFIPALPFELVSMLLLAAMVGCIVIAIKIPGRPSSGAGAMGTGDKDEEVSNKS